MHKSFFVKPKMNATMYDVQCCTEIQFSWAVIQKFKEMDVRQDLCSCTLCIICSDGVPKNADLVCTKYSLKNAPQFIRQRSMLKINKTNFQSVLHWPFNFMSFRPASLSQYLFLPSRSLQPTLVWFFYCSHK